jgi:tetratricopeptide (TPR) repeat protein
MSARFPSRWLSAAALLAATGLASAAKAQSPAPPSAPKTAGAAQTAPAPAVVPLPRLFVEPLPLEQEQVCEHGDMPQAARRPVPPPAPHVMHGPGLPECQTMPEDVMLRCLLFSVHPLAVFLPIQIGQTELPPPNYLQHTPLYMPAEAKAVPVPQALELLGMPNEVERLNVMPVEVEQINAMPAAEESELKYELLGPWTDSAHVLSLPLLPLAEIKVGVQEVKTGSLLFGVGAEVSRAGTVLVSTEPPSAEKKADTAEAQVMLDVLVAEVDRKGAKALGLDRAKDGKAAGWVIEVADEARQGSFVGTLKGLRRKNDAKFLAEPRLVTLNGQQGCFFSGGQQAVPTTAGALEFVEFGTKLTCCPTILAGGTIRLDAEPEISELCETANVTGQAAVCPSRSTQRVHTTADVPPGHSLLLSGPKAGGNTHLVVVVTPTVVEPPERVRGGVGQEDEAARERAEFLKNHPEILRQIEDEMEHFWGRDKPSRLSPERVQRGADSDDETVHDLLEKCQRELSRGHYAAAEDLARQALTRDRKEVEADPLVCQFNLLQRVKAAAVLPLGIAAPCAAKPEGRRTVLPGEDKAIGSDDRMVEALMQEYNAAYKESRYLDAAALAERVLQIDPDNAVAAAAVTVATTQAGIGRYPVLPHERLRWQAAQAMLSFQNHFKQGRYEEARAAALQALSVAPDDARALAALQMTSAVLSRQPHPAEPQQCPYVGPMRPLQPVDPAVVSALQKILIDRQKGDPAGGAEEAEPKAEGSKPAPRR